MEDLRFARAAFGFVLLVLMWIVASFSGPVFSGWFFLLLIFWSGWVCLKRFIEAVPISSNLDEPNAEGTE